MRILLLCTVFLVTGCGLGGGGGGSGDDSSSELPVSAATAEGIEASPRSILVGDRLKVTATLKDIVNDGVVIRFRYPKSLEYVKDSALLRYSDGTKVDIGPSNNKSSESETYLVFVLTQDSLDDEKRVEVSFVLEGASESSEARLEIDPDFIDQTKSSSKQFNISDPRFATKVETTVEVRK